MSDDAKKGWGWRAVFLAIGLFALAGAALCLFGAAFSGLERMKISRWPSAEATIQHCEITKHKRRDNTRFVYFAECGVTFNAGGETVKGGIESLAAYYEHRPKSWGDPGIDELRAWIAQHPDGSKIAIHYDPEWHPSAEPYPIQPLFDRTSSTIMLKVAAILAVVAAALIGLPFAMASRGPAAL